MLLNPFVHILPLLSLCLGLSLCSASSLLSHFGKGAELDQVLANTFSIFDKDGDGIISPTDLRAVFQSFGTPISCQEIDQIMQVADVEGRGFFDFGNFKSFMTQKSSDAVLPSTMISQDFADEDEEEDTEETIVEMFKNLDFNRDGFVSVQDLARVYQGLGLEITGQEITEIIASMDEDRDGRIGFDEFRRHFLRGN